MYSRSKPWWNSSLTEAFKDMRTARDMAKSYYQHFNQQSEIMLEEAKCLCKKALSLVKTTKWEYYLELTEGADMHDMWNFCKSTNGKWVYTSPALSKGDGEEPVVCHTCGSSDPMRVRTHHNGYIWVDRNGPATGQNGLLHQISYLISKTCI